MSLETTRVEIDASQWADLEEALSALARALRFPDYFGGNLDALVDCLRDVVDGDDRIGLPSRALAVDVRGYSRFAARSAGPASRLEATVADVSSEAAADGFTLTWNLDGRAPVTGGGAP
ncbi:barstar family protein [Nocardioides zeae]|uniref:Barstar family protein n=1 Tax=Nocardioides zeae TaxID=1457234 RepID=A0A6P0HF78_9ACTN|nr:barstar family protein [Nocardioides zeae]